ncbi:MAG: ribosome biogenesis GTPase YlqF [Vulcanimicrobiota bacterium]
MAKKKTPKNKRPKATKPEAERAFSWYPGHMVKAKRELEANLKLADAVLVMLDARAPISTRHPELEQILDSRSCPFGLVLNKGDLAEADKTEAWGKHLRAEGFQVTRMNSVQGRGPGALSSLLEQVERAVNQRRERKGLLPREPRLMVCGLPNSGKSTLLNRLVGKNRFKAGKKPGLTRGAQWVKVAGRYHLLDTPGILYPRIEGETSLSILAAIGSVKRNVLPQETVTRTLLRLLHERARLAEFLPELSGQEWEAEPLSCLSEVWGYQSRSGEAEPAHRAFERLLNLLSDASKPITWEPPPLE